TAAAVLGAAPAVLTTRAPPVGPSTPTGAAARGAAVAGCGVVGGRGVVVAGGAGPRVVVGPERQVQRVGTLARLPGRVVRRRRAARTLRTGGAALTPRPSRSARRTTSGAGPSLRAGAASAAAGSLPPAA
ncbi:hypothetical protein ABZ917_43005, partial [Nonomuraea wenchangensis]